MIAWIVGWPLAVGLIVWWLHRYGYHDDDPPDGIYLRRTPEPRRLDVWAGPYDQDREDVA